MPFSEIFGVPQTRTDFAAALAAALAVDFVTVALAFLDLAEDLSTPCCTARRIAASSSANSFTLLGCGSRFGVSGFAIVCLAGGELFPESAALVQCSEI